MWPQDVTKKDLRIDHYRGSGAGGQNRNKRDTACRITHIPTGISSTAEEYRTQGKNKEAAFERLAKKLVPLMQTQRKNHTIPEDEVRVYNEKRNQVKDHRVDKTFEMDSILNGDLDDLLHKLL